MWGPDKRRGRRVRPKGLLQYAQQDAVANPPLALDRGSNGSLLGIADAVGQATLGGLLTGVTSAPGSDAERAMLRGSGGAVMDMTPGVGDVKALTYDAPRLFGEGHPVMGGIAAASAIPLLGMPFDAARTLMKPMKNVNKSPVAYHVAGDGYDGGDLTSLYSRHGDQAYDIFASRWPDAGTGVQVDPHRVYLYRTIEEAQDHADEYGGSIIEVDLRDLDVKVDPDEGFQYVERSIPRSALRLGG